MLKPIFWCFLQCVTGFTHCRYILSVDGTFVTRKYKGTLMVIVGMTTENQLLQVFQSSIVLKQIQLSLNCPKNLTRLHLQMFFTHLLLYFIHHPLAKFISFSLNLIKKFLATLKHLPIAASCMLSIERFNTNNHNQC
jgi:hypothetical protein